MDEQEEIQQNNMISNLPLLFANGYPTSLDKITESQLQKFIPFMVQCSLGHINLQGQVDCSEPEWWPEDLSFTIPFTKPKKFHGDWVDKLKEVVLICYQFHKSVFLLRFCNDLSSYEHASLRFINNYNSTTSLFDRRSNKLLVTFRNENMSYDQPQRLRKCLLQQKSKNGHISTVLQQMVEPAPFDIYLCDNCDAELYSKEAILEHEKTCSVEDDDDDVILCDTPELFDKQQTEQKCSNSSNNNNNSILEDNEPLISFMLNFNLQYRSTTTAHSQHSQINDTESGTKESQQKESQFMIIDKKKRISRRSRQVHSVSRCPTIPLSSPAGQLLLRTAKNLITKEYLIERLDRVERFCPAPLLSKLTSRPKFLEKKTSIVMPNCTFKKPQDYSTHLYVFPRRQFSQKRRMENILLINSTLLRRCRPISVRLKKISDMKNRQQTLTSTKLNIKLTRDNSRSSNWKISSSPSTEIIVDTIDLCTSDEDDNQQITYQTSHISYQFDGKCFQQSNNESYNNNNNAPCLVKIVHNDDIENTTASTTTLANFEPSSNNIINRTIVSVDQDVDRKFIRPFEPTVYINSNCPTSPMRAILSTQQTNEVSKELDNQDKTIFNNSNTVSGNWFDQESNVNIESDNIDNNCGESNDLANNSSLGGVEEEHRSRKLPLIHQNQIVLIDLTS